MRRLLLATAISAFTLAATAKDPAMPAFTAELEPFLGTWKTIHVDEKKKVPLFLVIKQEAGQLRVRYQMPVRYKKYTSDWFGAIELDMQVNMKEKREVSYSVDAGKPAILTAEDIRFTGSPHAPRFHLEAAYTVADDGKSLIYECRSMRSSKGEESRCPAPQRWTRESADTKWPD